MSITRHVPPPRLSKKRAAKLKGKRVFSTISGPRKTVKARNSARRKREFARAYGSKERVEFVKTLPCIGHRRRIPGTVNHHIKTDGAGRKADARFTVPLCAECHDTIHQHGRYYYEIKHGVELEVQAELTEQAWHAHASRS